MLKAWFLEHGTVGKWIMLVGNSSLGEEDRLPMLAFEGVTEIFPLIPSPFLCPPTPNLLSLPSTIFLSSSFCFLALVIEKFSTLRGFHVIFPVITVFLEID